MRNTAQAKRLRRAALERDGWRCRDCGQLAVLEVHHVRPVRERPDLAYSLDNVRTLCRPCHLRFHRRPETPEERRWREFAAGPV